MHRTVLLGLFAILAFVGDIRAAITITADAGIPTPGLAGYKTYTVTATSDEAPIKSFDFATPVDPASPRGFFGSMNQINPFGILDTIFTDNNAAITGSGQEILADSQFKFQSTNVLWDLDSAKESSSSLQASFRLPDPDDFGLSVAFAQLVIPTSASATVSYRGLIGTTDGNEFAVSGFAEPPGPHPVPLVNDTELLVFEAATIQHTFTAIDDGPPSELTWSGFKFGGPGTAMAPTFDPQTQLFNWDTTGSVPGIYLATVTAMDVGGLSDTGTLTINLLVPEPASIVLLAVVACGLVGFTERTLLRRV